MFDMFWRPWSDSIKLPKHDDITRMVRNLFQIKIDFFSADYLAINCDACEITDTKYPCSNFLTKSINKGSSKSVPRPNCNNKIPTYSCPKCFSCSAFILKCSQLTINDTIQTIHDANKLTVDPNVSNSEYNEVSFILAISVITKKLMFKITAFVKI